MAQQNEEAESYFEAHKSSQVYTSDHTLSKLETPKLAPEQVAALLADSPSHHAQYIKVRIWDEGLSVVDSEIPS